MKILLFASVLFNIWAASSFSQAKTSPVGNNVEVGIVEHLGDTIPLSLKFTNEKDSLVSLGSMIDKPTVLSFVYFDCPGLCSPLLDGISQVIEKAEIELYKEYQVITVSFNDTDTPEKARKKKETFLKRHSKSHAANWIYLTGDSASINRLSQAVGFKYKKAGVDYVHPSAIMVLSPKGKITRYLYGLTFLPFDLKMAVVEAQKGQPRPTINKVLEFCYAYDPEGKRYALDITKVTGILMLFILLIFALTLFLKRKKKLTINNH